MSGVTVIYVDWPARRFGVTWHRLADALRDAGLTNALREAGHETGEAVLRAEGADAADLRGGMRLAGQVAEQIRAARSADRLALVVCGSCSVAAVAASAALGPNGLGIAWFDAHPDLNTPETSQSGLVDGMALAMALGRCWQAMTAAQTGLSAPLAPAVAFFGARDIDPPELAVMNAEKFAIKSEASELVRSFANSKNLYIHLDMDVHDAMEVRTNSFAVADGPGADDVAGALAALATSLPLACLAVTGLDPEARDGDKATALAIRHVCTVADCWSAAHA